MDAEKPNRQKGGILGTGRRYNLKCKSKEAPADGGAVQGPGTNCQENDCKYREEKNSG